MLLLTQIIILIVLVAILCMRGTKPMEEESDPIVWLCFVLSITDLLWILYTIGEMNIV